jgi:hypothetical protein
MLSFILLVPPLFVIFITHEVEFDELLETKSDLILLRIALKCHMIYIDKSQLRIV